MQDEESFQGVSHGMMDGWLAWQTAMYMEHIPCCIFGLLVILGLMVRSYGNNNSVIWFLFIRLFGFGFMSLPRVQGY